VGARGFQAGHVARIKRLPRVPHAGFRGPATASRGVPKGQSEGRKKWSRSFYCHTARFMLGATLAYPDPRIRVSQGELAALGSPGSADQPSVGGAGKSHFRTDEQGWLGTMARMDWRKKQQWRHEFWCRSDREASHVARRPSLQVGIKKKKPPSPAAYLEVLTRCS